MTSLTVQANGGPPVTADELNTFIQNCASMSVLRSFTGITGMQVFVQGTATPNDGGQGNFYWNATGVAADDNGVTTVVPNGAGSGEWTRINSSSVTNLTLAGTLTVAGLTTLNGELIVAGPVFLSGTIQGFLTAFNTQVGTTYTLASTDTGLTVTLNNAGAITVTLPNNLAAGFTCECIQLGAGQVTFTAAAGATLQNRSTQTKIAGQYGAVRLVVVTNSGGTSAVYNLAGDTSS